MDRISITIVTTALLSITPSCFEKNAKDYRSNQGVAGGLSSQNSSSGKTNQFAKGLEKAANLLGIVAKDLRNAAINKQAYAKLSLSKDAYALDTRSVLEQFNISVSELEQAQDALEIESVKVRNNQDNFSEIEVAASEYSSTIGSHAQNLEQKSAEVASGTTDISEALPGIARQVTEIKSSKDNNEDHVRNLNETIFNLGTQAGDLTKLEKNYLAATLNYLLTERDRALYALRELSGVFRNNVATAQHEVRTMQANMNEAEALARSLRANIEAAKKGNESIMVANGQLNQTVRSILELIVPQMTSTIDDLSTNNAALANSISSLRALFDAQTDLVSKVSDTLTRVFGQKERLEGALNVIKDLLVEDNPADVQESLRTVESIVKTSIKNLNEASNEIAAVIAEQNALLSQAGALLKEQERLIAQIEKLISDNRKDLEKLWAAASSQETLIAGQASTIRSQADALEGHSILILRQIELIDDYIFTLDRHAATVAKFKNLYDNVEAFLNAETSVLADQSKTAEDIVNSYPEAPTSYDPDNTSKDDLTKLEARPYQEICTKTQWLAYTQTAAKPNIKITCDIDFGGDKNIIKPINYLTHSVIDGNGHTLRNIVVSSGRKQSLGLIGRAYNVHIKDLTIEGLTLKGGSRHTGSLVGYMEHGSVRNVHVSSVIYDQGIFRSELIGGSPEEDASQFEEVAVGGLFGYGKGILIKDSYIDVVYRAFGRSGSEAKGGEGAFGSLVGYGFGRIKIEGSEIYTEAKVTVSNTSITRLGHFIGKLAGDGEASVSGVYLETSLRGFGHSGIEASIDGSYIRSKIISQPGGTMPLRLTNRSNGITNSSLDLTMIQADGNSFAPFLANEALKNVVINAKGIDVRGFQKPSNEGLFVVSSQFGGSAPLVGKLTPQDLLNKASYPGLDFAATFDMSEKGPMPQALTPVLLKRLSRQFGFVRKTTAASSENLDWAGLGDKWFLDHDRDVWYFVRAGSHEIRKWSGSGVKSEILNQSTIVGSIPSKAYQDLSMLYDADAKAANDVVLERAFVSTYSPDLNQDTFFDWGHFSDKWIKSAAGTWMFIMPNRHLYKWDGSTVTSTERFPGSSTFLGIVPRKIYQDLRGRDASKEETILLVPDGGVSIDLGYEKAFKIAQGFGPPEDDVTTYQHVPIYGETKGDLYPSTDGELRLYFAKVEFNWDRAFSCYGYFGTGGEFTDAYMFHADFKARISQDGGNSWQEKEATNMGFANLGGFYPMDFRFPVVAGKPVTYEFYFKVNDSPYTTCISRAGLYAWPNGHGGAISEGRIIFK